MARRIATIADNAAIATLYQTNRPDLAAMVASGAFLPTEHIRRKLADPNVVMAYDTAGGIVGLRYVPEEPAVIFEIGGFSALTAAARRTLWALAIDTWKARVPSTTRFVINCRDGDAIDTFLKTRILSLRTLINTSTSIPVPGAQPVTYQTTLAVVI